MDETIGTDRRVPIIIAGAERDGVHLAQGLHEATHSVVLFEPEEIRALQLKLPVPVITHERDLPRAETYVITTHPVLADTLDLSPVTNMAARIGSVLPENALVIVESRVNPGVSEEIILPALTREGAAIRFAYSPSRRDAQFSLRAASRIIGANDDESRLRARSFYESFVEATLYDGITIKEAEAVHMLDAAIRDVHGAFVNEFAVAFDRAGIDIEHVLRGASTYAPEISLPRPRLEAADTAFEAYYVLKRGHKSGFDHRFLKNAKKINSAMPAYAVSLLEDLLADIGVPIKSARIAVLGRADGAFHTLVQKKKAALVQAHDPRAPRPSLEEVLAGAHVAVLLEPHDALVSLDPSVLRKHGVTAVLDGCNAWSRTEFMRSGIRYRGIGRGY